MTIARFREIEAMMVDQDVPLGGLLKNGSITADEVREWLRMEVENS